MSIANLPKHLGDNVCKSLILRGPEPPPASTSARVERLLIQGSVRVVDATKDGYAML